MQKIFFIKVKRNRNFIKCFIDTRFSLFSSLTLVRKTLVEDHVCLCSVLCLFQVVNYSESRTAEEICESASKMITFIDLAGHHKYLKTTIFGLTSYCPDFAMLVVSANTGIGE